MKFLYVVLQIPRGFWATKDKALQTGLFPMFIHSGAGKIGLFLLMDGQEGNCLIPVYSWKGGAY